MKRALMCMVMGMSFLLPTASADVWLEHDLNGDGEKDFLSVEFLEEDTRPDAMGVASLSLSHHNQSQSFNFPIPAFLDPETHQPDPALNITLNVLPGKYFNGITVIRLDFAPQACGIGGGSSYFFWDGDKLTHAFNTERVSDAGVFHVEDNVTFQPDGVEVKITQLTDWDDAKADYTTEETTTRLYRWNGQALRLLKESKSSKN